MILDAIKWFVLLLFVIGIVGGLVAWTKFGAGNNDDGGQ